MGAKGIDAFHSSKTAFKSSWAVRFLVHLADPYELSTVAFHHGVGGPPFSNYAPINTYDWRKNQAHQKFAKRNELIVVPIEYYVQVDRNRDHP